MDPPHLIFFRSTSFVMDQSTEAIHCMLGPHRIHRNWVFPIQWKQRWMVVARKCCQLRCLKTNQAYRSKTSGGSLNLTDLTDTAVHYCWSNVPSRELTIPAKMAYLKMIFLFPRWDMLISWRVIVLVIHVTCRGVPWTGIPSSCGGCRFTWCRIALLPWE